MNKLRFEPYSFPEYLQRNPARRIWRVIYPALLFVLIQVMVGAIFVTITSIALEVQHMMSNGIPSVTRWDVILSDSDQIYEQAMEIFTKYSMHLVLLTDIAALAVFIPIWLKTRKYRPATIRTASAARPLILTFLLVPGISLLVSSIIELFGLNDMSETFQEVMEMITGTSFALQILAVVIIGPIAEELIFRGVILNRALSWMPKWAAITVSAALFGIIHMNFPQGIFAFCVGMICGWSYVRFRSVLIPIAAHVAVNLASTIINQISLGIDPYNGSSARLVTIFMLAVIALSAALVYPWLKTANVNVVYPNAILPDAAVDTAGTASAAIDDAAEGV
ncbi:MAG: CPBP family intramembrane metalloprotease [Oscillospiraceae bacterium]|jgi:membrane protease YdiL (CAAX protease family)|nr:CPBP family intramembrane metalloprotease [Oscillospiraceae bacterium]